MTADRAVLRALNRFARNSELMSLLDAPGLTRLARCGVNEHRDAQDVIVRQGDVGGQKFYLIVAGEVSVHVRNDFEDEQRVVATLTPGHFFGEIGTLTQQPRSATVVCKTPVELVAFDREPVLQVFADYPSVKEVIGSVGLARTEENLRVEGLPENMDVDLATMLEGPED